jgi:hypothetical protein
VEWLHQNSQSRFRAEIDRPGRFVAHLFGHMHEAAARVLSEGGAPTRRELQGLSLFGLEIIEDSPGKKTERLHGYAALRLSVQDRQGTLAVWPRSYELNRVAGYPRMVPDHHRYDLEDEAVVWHFTPLIPFTRTTPADSVARPTDDTVSDRTDRAPVRSTASPLRPQVLAAIAMLSELRKKADAYRHQLSRYNAGLPADGLVEQLTEAEVAAVEGSVRRLSTQILGAPPADAEWQGLKDFCRPHDEYLGGFNRSNEAYYGWILHWTDATRLLLEGYLAAADSVPANSHATDAPPSVAVSSAAGTSLTSGAPMETDARSESEKQVHAARIVLDLTCGSAPNEDKLRRLDDDFFNDFWSSPDRRASCRFSHDQVVITSPDRCPAGAGGAGEKSEDQSESVPRAASTSTVVSDGDLAPLARPCPVRNRKDCSVNQQEVSASSKSSRPSWRRRGIIAAGVLIGLAATTFGVMRLISRPAEARPTTIEHPGLSEAKEPDASVPLEFSASGQRVDEVPPAPPSAALSPPEQPASASVPVVQKKGAANGTLPLSSRNAKSPARPPADMSARIQNPDNKPGTNSEEAATEASGRSSRGKVQAESQPTIPSEAKSATRQIHRLREQDGPNAHRELPPYIETE